jgi:hypothetical protein
MSDPFDGLTLGQLIGIIGFDADTPEDFIENLGLRARLLADHRGEYRAAPPRFQRLMAAVERRLDALAAAPVPSVFSSPPGVVSRSIGFPNAQASAPAKTPRRGGAR